MSERLEKAKAALHAAKNHDRNDQLQDRLLDIARTQAAIATAEAVEHIEELLIHERNLRDAQHGGRF